MHKTDPYHEYLMFFAYTLFVGLRTVLLMAMRRYIGLGSAAYFIAYCVTMLGDTAFALLIIREVYANILYGYDGLRVLSAMIFRWTWMLLVLVTIIAACGVPDGDTNPLFAAMTVFDRGAMMVEFALIILLFVLAKTLSLGWRTCVFGIAAGMCLLCSLDLAALALRVPYVEGATLVYSAFRSICCICGLAIWTVYLYRSRRRNHESSRFRSDTCAEWNAAILRHLKR